MYTSVWCFKVAPYSKSWTKEQNSFQHWTKKTNKPNTTTTTPTKTTHPQLHVKNFPESKSQQVQRSNYQLLCHSVSPGRPCCSPLWAFRLCWSSSSYKKNITSVTQTDLLQVVCYEISAKRMFNCVFTDSIIKILVGEKKTKNKQLHSLCSCHKSYVFLELNFLTKMLEQPRYIS